MHTRLSPALYAQAIAELKVEITTILERFPLNNAANIEDPLQDRAEEVLNERLNTITVMNQKFDEILSQAHITSHLDALRDGHFKEMRRFLRFTPGVSKETAKQINKELFGHE